MRTIDIVFQRDRTGLSTPRFVEVERDGKSISIGEWIDRDDGFDVLRIPDPQRPATTDSQLIVDSGLNFWAMKLVLESAMQKTAATLIDELGSLALVRDGLRITIEKDDSE